MNAAPDSIRTLVDRFDATAFDARKRTLRLRLVVGGEGEWDVLVKDGAAAIAAAGGRADAVLRADAASWRRIAADLRNGIDEFRSGRLSVRENLHAGVGFLAATSGATEEGRLRFRSVKTASARLSIIEAGTGEPVVRVAVAV